MNSEDEKCPPSRFYWGEAKEEGGFAIKSGFYILGGCGA